MVSHPCIDTAVEIPNNVENIENNSNVPSSVDEIDIVYSVTDVPPFPVSIMLSLQQFITVSCSIVMMPFIVCPALCMSNTDPGKAYILSTMYFVIGLATFFQILFGVRLPVVQGMAPSFLIPITNLMTLPQFRCPSASNALINEGEGITQTSDTSYSAEIWEGRLREIQGCIAIASCVQVLLSVTGLLSCIIHLITPVVVIPIFCLIGLSFISNVTEICSGNWIISLVTALLIIICSQHLQQIPLPFIQYRRRKGFHIKWFTWFKFFPVITSVMIMWIICHILTIYNVLQPGNAARTDTNKEIVKNTLWFKFPYPGQWGSPTISIPGTVAMLYSAFVAIIESVGSYYACARLTGVPPPPKPAINRGIFVEGLGSLFAGLLGTGSGCTTSSESMSAINITKTATRRAIQLASIYMLICGVFTKLVAGIVSIPSPIIGGLMIVSFSLTSGIGLSLTRYINFNSSRNIFILGFSIWFGLAMPEWVSTHRDFIHTGSVILNEIIYILFATSMFVGGLSAFILDKTIPGLAVDKDSDQWLNNRNESGECKKNYRADISLYDLAYGAECSHKVKFFQYIPLCPTFGQKKITQNENSTIKL
ncbi:hypothetical protein CHUAL_008693 [Chamberlinius hualienensis]